MNNAWIFIAGFGFSLFISSVIMLVRNNALLKYRLDLIDKISKASHNAIAKGNYNFEWRYDAFRKVSYDKMLYQFWKRFDSFYPDKSFLQ